MHRHQTNQQTLKSSVHNHLLHLQIFIIVAWLCTFLCVLIKTNKKHVILRKVNTDHLHSCIQKVRLDQYEILTSANTYQSHDSLSHILFLHSQLLSANYCLNLYKVTTSILTCKATGQMKQIYGLRLQNLIKCTVAIRKHSAV